MHRTACTNSSAIVVLPHLHRPSMSIHNVIGGHYFHRGSLRPKRSVVNAIAPDKGTLRPHRTFRRGTQFAFQLLFMFPLFTESMLSETIVRYRQCNKFVGNLTNWLTYYATYEKYCMTAVLCPRHPFQVLGCINSGETTHGAIPRAIGQMVPRIRTADTFRSLLTLHLTS